MGKRKALPSKSGALVHVSPAPKPVPARTEAQLRQLAETVVETVNRALRRASLEHEEISDYLLDVLFEHDTAAALFPDRRPTDAYRLVRARAGRSLGLDPAELVLHLRVGALNRLARDDAWRGLEWSKKVELLPLVAADEGLQSFHRGVRYAVGPNVGRVDVRTWVQKELPRLEGSPGRPRGLTLTAGDRIATTCLKLEKKEQRAALVRRLARVPPERRRAFAAGLRAAARNLLKLVKDIEDGGDDE